MAFGMQTDIAKRYYVKAIGMQERRAQVRIEAKNGGYVFSMMNIYPPPTDSRFCDEAEMDAAMAQAPHPQIAFACGGLSWKPTSATGYMAMDARCPEATGLHGLD